MTISSSGMPIIRRSMRESVTRRANLRKSEAQRRDYCWQPLFRCLKTALIAGIPASWPRGFWNTCLIARSYLGYEINANYVVAVPYTSATVKQHAPVYYEFADKNRYEYLLVLQKYARPEGME